jgi:transcriptional regulator with XRE-family HTH domain
MTLDNQTVGRNISQFRNLRQKKALEVADHLGIKEAAYTKYERGETKITIDFIQNVSEFLEVDPVHILFSNPEKLLEGLYQSSTSVDLKSNPAHSNNCNQTVLQLLECILSMNQSIKEILTAGKKITP